MIAFYLNIERKKFVLITALTKGFAMSANKMEFGRIGNSLYVTPWFEPVVSTLPEMVIPTSPEEQQRQLRGLLGKLTTSEQEALEAAKGNRIVAERRWIQEFLGAHQANLTEFLFGDYLFKPSGGKPFEVPTVELMNSKENPRKLGLFQNPLMLEFLPGVFQAVAPLFEARGALAKEDLKAVCLRTVFVAPGFLTAVAGATAIYERDDRITYRGPTPHMLATVLEAIEKPLGVLNQRLIQVVQTSLANNEYVDRYEGMREAICSLPLPFYEVVRSSRGDLIFSPDKPR